MYLAILAGFLYDRHGPVPTTVVGVSLVFTGYFLLYLGAAGHIACPVWAVRGRPRAPGGDECGAERRVAALGRQACSQLCGPTAAPTWTRSRC